MRMWTALGAWAGLIAVSIALYALGLSLESKPKAGHSALVPIALVFAGVATLIFLGDLAYLGRRELRRRRASRAPRKEYGQLDYGPEFNQAAQRYSEAQQRITEKTVQTAAIFGKNQMLTSQAQADESAKAAEQLCATYEELLPVMRENGEIMRECLPGLLKQLRPTSAAERDAVRELLSSTRGAREGTVGYLRSMRGAKRTTARLRKRNFSASLNESSTRLRGQLKGATRTVRRTIRVFRAAEWRMMRRLLWYSLRRRKVD